MDLAFFKLNYNCNVVLQIYKDSRRQKTIRGFTIDCGPIYNDFLLGNNQIEICGLWMKKAKGRKKLKATFLLRLISHMVDRSSEPKTCKVKCDRKSHLLLFKHTHTHYVSAA